MPGEGRERKCPLWVISGNPADGTSCPLIAATGHMYELHLGYFRVTHKGGRALRGPYRLRGPTGGGSLPIIREELGLRD